MLKSFFYKVCLLLILTAAICACDKEDSAPSTITITDADGIEIELTWTTGSTEEAALDEADLDLYVYDNLNDEFPYHGSAEEFEFEELIFDELDDDGNYTVTVSVFALSKKTDYTVEVSGVTVDKSIKVKGSFAATTIGETEIDVFKLTKSGSTYTLVKL